MKRITHIRRIASAIALTAAGVAALQSCDALWGTSVGVEAGTPYYEWDGEWLPTLAGTPIYSPYYYGGTSYPLGPWQPIYRPGVGPWGNPVGGAGLSPSGRPNRPEGNLRPSQPTPSQPSTRPAGGSATTQPLYPNNPLNGSNPGIQLPPPGTGYRTGK